MQRKTCALTRSSRRWWIGRSSSGPLSVRKARSTSLSCFVGADDVGCWKLACDDAGAQHVDAVECGLGADLFLFTLEGETAVADRELEVLADAPAVPDRADSESDRGLALERALLDALLDLGERTLGGLEQVLTLASPLGRDQGVAADDQPLAQVVVAVDLGQVVLVEQRQLQRPIGHELFHLRRLQRGDPGGAV